MFKIKDLILLLFFINACTTQNDDFSSNEKIITGVKLDIGCMIGMPNELIFLNPLLLFCDRYENQLITVFDTEKKQFVRRFLSIGQGPGEVVPPLRLFASPIENKISMFQTNAAYLNIYEIDDVIEKSNVSFPEQVYFEDRPAVIKKVSNGYLGIGLFEDGRFRMYDTTGKNLYDFGKYPFRGDEMDPVGRFFVYQGFVSTSMDGSYFAIGTSYCDNLEFYRVVDGKAELIKRYESRDAKAIYYGNSMRIDDDCIMNYKATFGGKYCYMLYSGKPYLDNGKRRTVGGKKIIVFNWDGNYIKSYKADVEILSFCVDEVNDIIYASIIDEDDETGGGYNIVQFNL